MREFRAGSVPVLVIGGGIGGLSAALALSQRGHPVEVWEQAAEFGEVGAGLQVGPNMSKMFDFLGVLDEVMRVAYFPQNLILMDALSAEEITRVPLGEDFRARFTYPYATIHRADLHVVLLEACRASPLIELKTNRKLLRFDQDGEGATAYAEGGQISRGKALVGCDGTWSAVRACLLADGEPRVTGHIAYRAVLPMREIPAHLQVDSVVLWAGPNLHLAHYPLRRGELFNMGAIFHSNRYEDGWDSYGDPEELHERFTGVCDEVATLLDRIETWRMWVLRDRDPVDNWSSSRVTLLGDAAHPTLQYLAQGAAMAVEDAVILAHQISEHPDNYAAAFRAYQKARYVRTARVQLFSRYYGDLYHASGIARDVRREMLANWPADAARQSFAWIYDGVGL